MPADVAAHESGSPVRRLTTSLLGRRWSVFIAELVLVVAGILIALAIDGWIQDRQDRRSETIYLQLLSRDLEKIEDEFQHYVDFENENLATGARAYAAVADRNLPGDVDALQRVISALGSRRTLQIHSATYDDLTSTGNLQLIRDRALRERIISHFADVRRTELIIEKNNRLAIDEMFFPFLQQAGITSNLQDHPTRQVREASRAVMEILGDDYVPPVDAILMRPPGDPAWNDIRRQILFRMRIASIGAVVGADLIESTRALRAVVDGALEERAE
ncbi:MAG: hypothetical protein R3358_03195 [Woeseiaceae bacterium]|nr:hypothetical protein [Woeseiaceae bacterium]